MRKRIAHRLLSVADDIAESVALYLRQPMASRVTWAAPSWDEPTPPSPVRSPRVPTRPQSATRAPIRQNIRELLTAEVADHERWANQTLEMVDNGHQAFRKTFDLMEGNMKALLKHKDDMMCQVCEEAARKLQNVVTAEAARDALHTTNAMQVGEIENLRSKVAALEEQLREQGTSAAGVATQLNQALANEKEARIEALATEQEARIEHVSVFILRSIIHRDVRRAFNSWVELREARSFAFGRLKQAALRLRNSVKARAFREMASTCERLAQAKLDAARETHFNTSLAERDAENADALKRAKEHDTRMAAIVEAHAVEVEWLKGEIEAHTPRNRPRESPRGVVRWHNF